MTAIHWTDKLSSHRDTSVKAKRNELKKDSLREVAHFLLFFVTAVASVSTIVVIRLCAFLSGSGN